MSESGEIFSTPPFPPRRWLGASMCVPACTLMRNDVTREASPRAGSCSTVSRTGRSPGNTLVAGPSAVVMSIQPRILMKGRHARLQRRNGRARLGGGVFVLEVDIDNRVVHRLLVTLPVPLDPEVELRALLGRNQGDIASFRDGHASLIEGAEVIGPALDVAPSFGRVNRHPSHTVDVELGPAVEVVDLAFVQAGWNLHADHRHGGYADGAAQTHERRRHVHVIPLELGHGELGCLLYTSPSPR